ncbi:MULTISPECIES: flagellar hook-associated protein FlgK [unclassified Pseudomonas]|uniref:flagellar hook-associated protein FlgK n=1 Tax=unclassified Pseudomonas TaxID=196821 RepID=UPI000C882915|nr:MULTISPECIES: flagellar hook-associated protein FlgK [unclassified Pseudomonas]PMZ91698.1 flagellar hook-associated protein FlgK [Pseudomonas sp. FW215-T2]PNA14343.1 flagellar hook-associated protein FlgK [Pseudomonas sp. FW215-R3]PNB38944.1 flagellar hook-associated protein FlgK [Pseudomonas sp. FW305-131]
MSLLNIGMSGLSAGHNSLVTTGNNIANVDTAGYSRQQSVQSTKGSIQYGNVFIGTGTTLADVRRVYNAYLDSQLRTATSLNSEAASYNAQATPLDATLSDTNTGLTGVLQKFFTSMQGVSTSATDDTSRQSVLTGAQALSARFNSIAKQLNDQNTNLNGSLGDMADQVNKLSTTIATLNQKISELSTGTNQPNDLLDSRNEAVRQLSELVGTQVVERGSSYDIYIGSGQPLVVGNTTNSLQTVPSQSDPSRMALQLNRGSSTIDVTSVISGGEIGGLLTYRKEVLDPSLNELGRVALVVADQINSQQAQGIDKNGDFGAAIFNNINSAALISQRSIAAAGNSTGSGNLDVTIKDTGKLTASDYQVTFTSATNYTVKRSDGTDMGSFSTTTTPAPVIDGFSLNLNGGALSAGDSFKVTPTRGAAAGIQTVLTDPKKIAAAAPLTGVTSANNTGTYTQPTLTSTIDIYNPAAQAEMQTALKNSTPVKLVFGAASGGSQTYNLVDAKGNSIGTGTIVPGQSNTLNLKVGMVDASGAPVMDNSVTPAVQKTFTVQTTVGATPASGESFTINLTGAASSDNRNAQALVGLQTKQTVDTGTASKGISLTDAYNKLVTNVGAKAAQGKSDSDATTAILANAKGARDSNSGVDLDEETGNLVKYQQYYTASSQIIKAAQEIFTTLINSL